MSFLAMIAGSKLGRMIAGIALAAGTLLIIFGKIFSAGRAKERLKAQQQTLKTMKKALEVDQELGGLSAIERRDRLREWATDP